MFDSEKLDEILEFIDVLGDRRYTLQELVLCGGVTVMMRALLVFEDIDEPIPAINALNAIALLIGADTWRSKEKGLAPFQCHRMKVAIRRRVLELRAALNDKPHQPQN